MLSMPNIDVCYGSFCDGRTTAMSGLSYEKIAVEENAYSKA